MAQSVGVLGYKCHWGPPPEQEYKVNASAGVQAGQLVYLDTTTKLLTAVATDGVLCIGWAAQDAGVNEQCKVMRAFPGVFMEMKFAGTWAFEMLGQLVEITVTTGSDIVDVDANTNHLLKIEELLSNTATDKRVLVSLAAAANQNIIEVA